MARTQPTQSKPIPVSAERSPAGTAARALPWLLVPDPANPGVRYYALRHLLDKPETDREVRQSRRAVMAGGPVPQILAAQRPGGEWVVPRGGAKYQATHWQIILLAELGADPADPRVMIGCEHVLSRHLAANGAFANSLPPVPSAAVHCGNGSLIRALLALGWGGDQRVRAALDWQARAITGEPPVRYYKSATAGPGFACGVNLGQPCAWGATKALRALAAVPAGERSPLVQRAISVGAEFLLSHDPATADYPYTERVSGSWFKFGFPLSYWSDVLETTQVLIDLGFGADPRLANAVALIRSKADAAGRWELENSLNGKMWADIEVKGKPSKWVTLRALRALKGIAEAA